MYEISLPVDGQGVTVANRFLNDLGFPGSMPRP
jgi:hypothetical protein